MTTEIWKDIKGYNGMYQVSSQGRIKRVYTPKSYKHIDKILNPLVSNSHTLQYLRIGLWQNGNKKRYMVHRLVADAFMPNKEADKLQVHHKDYDTWNNNIANLEWVTPLYNGCSELKRRHIAIDYLM